MQLKFLQLLIGSVAINQQRTFLLQINWTCALIQNFDIITTSSQKIFIINSLFYLSNMQIINIIILSLFSLFYSICFFLFSILADQVKKSTAQLYWLLLLFGKFMKIVQKQDQFRNSKCTFWTKGPLVILYGALIALPITSGLSTWHVNLHSSSTACLASQCTTLISCTNGPSCLKCHFHNLFFVLIFLNKVKHPRGFILGDK